MDIINIVNTMQPETIAKLALKAEDFHGEPSIPFMGCFVQLFPNAVLPSPSDVTNYKPTFEAMIADVKAEAQAKAATPDLATQIYAALVAKGILTPNDIASHTLDTVNDILQVGGKAVIK